MNAAQHPRLHLTVFGASRGIGFETVRQAFEAGHIVTAVCRNGGALRAQFPKLRVIEGDASDPATVDRALRLDTSTTPGSEQSRAPVDAVICALGAPALSDSKIRTEGTRAIVAGMQRAGVQRIAAVSVMGAAESRDQLPWFYRAILFPLYLRKAVAEHEEQERILAASSLEWTAVRPPNLTEGARTPNVAAGVFDDWSPLEMSVPRADVAQILLRCVVTGEFLRQTPVVATPKVSRNAA